MVATNKFYVLLSEEIICQYCELSERAESSKEGLDEKGKKDFKEAEFFFNNLYQKGAEAAVEVINKINGLMAEYLDTKVNPEDEKANLIYRSNFLEEKFKDKFNDISEAIGNLLNSEQGIFKVLWSAT